MGQFTVKSQTSNTNYEYSNSTLIVQGSYAEDAITHTLQSCNGSCYRKDAQGNMGQYIGNFNGIVRDGVIKYSMSEMSRQDANAVWDAIDEIEPYMTGENSEE